MTSKLKTHVKHFVIGSLIAAFGASAYVIAAVTFSDFVGGTTISATEMNTKLNALKNAVNSNSVASVAGVAFSQENDGDVSTTGGCKIVRTSGYAYYMGGNNCDALAAIALPHGATLTGLSCLTYDNSATAGAAITYVLLRRMNLATGTSQTVYQTGATTDSASVQTLSDTTATAGTDVVDNNGYAYYMFADFGTADLSTVTSAVRLYGCKVSY